VLFRSAVYRAASASTVCAAPVPFYNSHVTAIERIGDGSVVIKTRDTPDKVYVWYRSNLKNANGDTKTEDGAHILYTQSGATVDIEPGNSFAPDTAIGIVWDARKFGAYRATSRAQKPATKASIR